MKIKNQILNILTGFLAIIGLCAVVLVCFIIGYTQLKGGFSKKGAHSAVSDQSIAVAQLDNTEIPTAEGNLLTAPISSNPTTFPEQNILPETPPHDEESIEVEEIAGGSQSIISEDASIKTGWIKESDQWYYFDSTGKARTDDLLTDVMTFKFNPDGSCYNFYENTIPSEQAGWSNYSTSSISRLATNILKGNVIYYAGQYWATPDYFNMLKNEDIVYEHDIATDNGQTTEPVNRYSSSDLDIVPSENSPNESLTGIVSEN